MPTSYAVTRRINAEPERVWRLLTDGEDYPRWNPSVVSLRGRIASGEQIELVSTVNTKRRFVLSVSELEPERRMVWSSRMPLGLFRGVRTFVLETRSGSQSEFSMREEYSGPLAGLMTRAIPDQNEAFGQFADGLKAAAESDDPSQSRDRPPQDARDDRSDASSRSDV